MRPRPHTQELHFGTAATTAQSFSGMSASYDITAILCPTQAASGYNGFYTETPVGVWNAPGRCKGGHV
jgi:hypothetical protein